MLFDVGQIQDDGTWIWGGTIPTSPNTTLNADGSAIFSGGDVILAANGAATFRGPFVTVGNVWNSADDLAGTTIYNGLVRAKRTSGASAADSLYEGYFGSGTDPTSKIMAEGSAFFSQNVTVGGTFGSETITLDSSGLGTFTGGVRITGGAAADVSTGISGAAGGNVNVIVNNDLTAEFERGRVGLGGVAAGNTDLFIDYSRLSVNNDVGINLTKSLSGATQKFMQYIQPVPVATTTGEIVGVNIQCPAAVNGINVPADIVGFRATQTLGQFTGNGETYGFQGGLNETVGRTSYNIFADGDAPNYFRGSMFGPLSIDGALSAIGAPTLECPFINDQAGIYLTQTSNNLDRAAIEIRGVHTTNSAVNVFNFTKGNSSDQTSARAGFIRISAPTGASSGVVYDCGANSTANGFVSSSDYRMKENFASLDNAVDRVKLLQPKRFNYIGDTETVDGFIAHEVGDACPEAVFGTKDAMEEIGTLRDALGEVLSENCAEPDESEMTYNEEVLVSPYVAADPENGVEEEEAVYETVTRSRTWTATGERPVYQGVDQTKLIPLLTKALQEALEKIDALEARLDAAGA